MKASLHENQLECYEQVYTGQKVIDVTGESVVPDIMPDIGLLGETNAHVFLRSKRVDSGTAIMEGDLDTGVCYLPDGVGGFQRLNISVPWMVQFEAEGLSDRCIALGEIRLQNLETRMLNPRKVMVKAQLCAVFTAYEKKTIAVCDTMEEDSKVQIRQERASCNLIGTVCEKTFVATDEYPLSADLAGGEILSKSVQFRVDDVKTLANKLIVKGSALSEMVIATKSGTAERVSFTSGFSFISETDCENVSANVRAIVMATGLYFDMSADGRVITVEIHGVCQLISYIKMELDFISDAYSNFCDCQMEHNILPVWSEMKNSLMRESESVILPARSQVARVQFTTVSMYTPVKSGKEIQLPMTACVCVQYENGSLDYLKKQFHATIPLKEGETLSAARISDFHCMANGNEVELRVNYDGELWESHDCQVKMISAIELDEEHPCCQLRPTITVIRAGGSLWDLGKKYGSTISLIQQFNQLEETEVAPNTLLLIPKQHI